MPDKKKIVEEETKDDGKIQFFGEIDLNPRDGTIRSEMPAWYFDVHIDELREGINRKKGAIERQEIVPDQVMMIKEEIKLEEAKLKKIEEGKPNLTGSAQDKAWRAYEKLAKDIASSMPTHRENLKGLVSPHEELKRQKNKHIGINPEIAKACGVKAVRGKISGDEANKCYKILGRALGENTNVERLRREGNSEAQHSMHELTKAILEGKNIGRVE